MNRAEKQRVLIIFRPPVKEASEGAITMRLLPCPEISGHPRTIIKLFLIAAPVFLLLFLLMMRNDYTQCFYLTSRGMPLTFILLVTFLMHYHQMPLLGHSGLQISNKNPVFLHFLSG